MGVDEIAEIAVLFARAEVTRLDPGGVAAHVEVPGHQMELAQGVRRGERGARTGRRGRDGRDDLRHAERLRRLGRKNEFGFRLVIGVLRRLAGEEVYHVHTAEVPARIQVNQQRVGGDGE